VASTPPDRPGGEVGGSPDPFSDGGGDRPRLIVDCDPGLDDAAALVLANHFADLVGITTVGGNAPLEQTTYNAMVMRDLLGVEVPIHSGAARPLVVEPVSGHYIHGASGLDGADLPPPTSPLDGEDAVTFIIDTCRATEGLWLVPTGPQTNIASALRDAPDIGDRIAGISLMGGGSFGNRTAAAEYNIWADPHAAEIVFGYGGRLVMAGLDVTYGFQATPERIEAVRSLPGRLAGVLAELFEFFSAAYIRRHDPGAIRGAAVHDPLAVLAVTHRNLFQHRERHIAIETEGVLTRGMTVIDDRLLVERPPPNTEQLTDIDDDAAFALLLDAVAHFSR
jgi:inosine-uridine nucleoside N-ribohydrolase